MTITTIFFDVGGVILTNGWDRHSRAAVTARFGLDQEEFADRHDFVANAFEVGEMTLQEYLERTVFYRDRDFEPHEFVTAMKDESKALPGMTDLLTEVASTSVLMATLNNESAELNRHRIETFELARFFSFFLSSSSLGVKKPEAAIYRMALDITMRDPSECVFVDDREINLECAAAFGIQTVLHTDVDSLRQTLGRLGVLAPT